MNEEQENLLNELITAIRWTLNLGHMVDLEIAKSLGKNLRRTAEVSVKFFDEYKRENKLNDVTDLELLQHAAKNLPSIVVKDTKLYNPEERQNDNRADDFLAFAHKVCGKIEEIRLTYKDERGVTFQELIVPSEVSNGKLSYEEFKNHMLNSLQTIFGSDREITVTLSEPGFEPVVEMVSLVDKKDGTTVSIDIEIEGFHHEYILGESLGDVILNIVKKLEKKEQAFPHMFYLAKNLKNFEKIKDSIFLRTTNYTLFKDSVLKNAIYKRVGDIALYVCTLMWADNNFLSANTVLKPLLEDWNISDEELFIHAKKNTYKRFRPYVIPLVLSPEYEGKPIPDENRYFMDDDFELLDARIFQLYLDGSPNGACAIFYEDTLPRLAQLLNSNLYIVMICMDYAMVLLDKKLAKKAIETAEKMDRDTYIEYYGYKENALSNKLYFYNKHRNVLSTLSM